MVNTKLETQRKTILHFWLNDIRSAKEIHQRTKIPLRTIERNLQKLRETGTVERKHSSGRPSKVTQTLARSLGQHIRHNSAIMDGPYYVNILQTQFLLSQKTYAVEAGVCNKTMILITLRVLQRNFLPKIKFRSWSGHPTIPT